MAYLFQNYLIPPLPIFFNETPNAPQWFKPIIALSLQNFPSFKEILNKFANPIIGLKVTAMQSGQLQIGGL